MSLGDRVRKARKAKKLTQIQLVAAVKRRGGDLSQPQLSAIEKDDVESPGSLLDIAAVLGVTAEELAGKPPAKPKKGEHETPVRHYVGAGDEVHLFDGDDAFDQTAAPPGFEGDKGAAAIVKGESMRPTFDDGDMLFFRHRFNLPATAKDVPVRAVIVQVRNGPLYVKKLLPGTRKGRYHLLSINPLTPTLQDQLVESFAYIEWVKPKAV